MRLLIVSNRLPFTAVEEGDELSFRESVGGLVSGLSSYLDSLKNVPLAQADYIWIGWPGLSIAAVRQPDVQAQILEQFQAWPVFVDAPIMEEFYHGFCNKTLWPLFHYFPSFTTYDQAAWQIYQQVNAIFCAVVLQVAQPGDVVWIHDYHLMLLPQMLRERRPDLTIGFFLHIPFPTYEVYRMLPSDWRADLLQGLLGADLLGFHTHDDTQYFLTCVTRILGIEPDGNTITVDQRVLRASHFPISIDIQRFARATERAAVQEQLHHLRERLAGRRAIISVDRLDYSKGILNQLQGYEIFLEQNPAWAEQVMLILVVVPSRIGVDRYQVMRQQIDESVGRINGRYGSVHWTPVVYHYRYMPFETLVAFYAASDVALITPLRDGMNLVAKEYVACRTDQTGVLILSEFAGAAKELTEAIIINPNNRQEIASALNAALMMDPAEQRRRNTTMQDRLQRYDVVKWATDFIATVHAIKAQQMVREVTTCAPVIIDALHAAYRSAHHRLILLDYDGTLVPFAPTPEAAAPAPEVLQMLAALTTDPTNHVVIISGRERRTLEHWLGGLNLTLIAEHGVWNKYRGQPWALEGTPSSAWKDGLRSVLEAYVDHVPDSLIEEKEFCLAWHYRKVEPSLGQLQAKALIRELEPRIVDLNLESVHGNKVVEIRNRHVHKGTAALRLLTSQPFDFILALGDDWTDEDLFVALPPAAYSIKVGFPPTTARFHVPTQAEVLALLLQLSTLLQSRFLT